MGKRSPVWVYGQGPDPHHLTRFIIGLVRLDEGGGGRGAEPQHGGVGEDQVPIHVALHHQHIGLPVAHITGRDLWGAPPQPELCRRIE